MIRTSKAPVAVPLPWDTGVSFMIRAGDVIERGEFEAELAANGAPRVYDFQLREVFVGGVKALLGDSPEDAARIEEIADADAALENDDKIDPADEALLTSAREQVQAHWPPYRAMIAAAARRQELIPVLAFQRFCTGWTGDDELPAYRKAADGALSLEVVGEMPALVLRVIGMKAYQMLHATADASNSAPRLPSDKSPRPSTSGTPRKVGTSRAKSGAKTRSSSSRKTASRSSTSGSNAAA